MPKTILLKAFLLVGFQCLLPVVLFSKSADTIRIEKVLQSDWGAYIHYPPSTKPLPAFITLGGSEGGLSFVRSEADSMAKEGFVVMRFGYFKYSKATQGQTLKEIRLEKILEGIEFLKKKKEVDSQKIGLLGVSKGAEAALLVASKTPSIKAVVAHLPSNLVWYGMGKWKGLNKSSWTWQGKSVDFQPFAKPKSGWFTKRIAEFYEAGLEKYPEKISAATIEVEKINGPILLSSGGKDMIWPSEFMAQEIENRLQAKNFSHEVKHLRFPDAGHGIFGTLPKTTDKQAFEELAGGGGSPEANFAARKTTWRESMSFFKRAFE